MIPRFPISLLLSLSVFAGVDAAACSCGAPQDVKSSVREATVVVLAEVVSSEQHPTETNVRTITEEVTFRVVRTFKGTLKQGDVLRTSSTLGPSGPCGISVKNSPVWLESGKTGTPTKLSGRWVLFGAANQPFELSMCGPSVPMEGGGAGVIRQLRGMAKRSIADHR